MEGEVSRNCNGMERLLGDKGLDHKAKGKEKMSPHERSSTYPKAHAWQGGLEEGSPKQESPVHL